MADVAEEGGFGSIEFGELKGRRGGSARRVVEKISRREDSLRLLVESESRC